MDNKNIFAKNLKKYMELNNKSRRDVCEAIGVSYYTFTDWVNGKKFPRMDKVEILANYFGILKSDLIEEKVTEETKNKSKVAVDLTIRLGADKEFAEVVKRMYADNNFFALNKMLCKLNDEQIESVKNIIKHML